MNKIPSELFNIICENLSHYDKLMLSTCTKESSLFSCKMNRNECKRKISFAKSKLYIIPSNKNPIFETIEDISDIEEDLNELSPIEKRDCIFSFMHYFSSALLNNIKYPSFEKNTDTMRLKHRCFVKRIGGSLFRWGLEHDRSEILLNKQKSIIYNVRAPSHQYSKILHSRTLKALIG